MHDVKGILDFLGYDQLRRRGDTWRPLSEVDDRFGTTDETHIWRRDERPRVRLVDGETNEEIAFARKSQHTDT